MKQAMIDYVQNGPNDQYSTPAYAVTPLLKYLDKSHMIWEPTDTTGAIRRVLKKNLFAVLSTNKDTHDFTGPPIDMRFDCIVTNPPYSIKDSFIESAIWYWLNMRKPWAMLMPLTTLEGVRRHNLFKMIEDDFGLMVFDRRIEFSEGSNWFNASWFTCGILPKQIIFEKLIKE